MARTALLVEDNDLLARIYKALFAQLGCELVHAPTVRRALELLAVERPLVAVVDLRLPDGSGIDVIRAIRAHPELNAVPVVTVTTLAVGPERLRAEEAGSTVVVAKPVNLEDFTRLLERFLGGAADEGGGVAGPGIAPA